MHHQYQGYIGSMDGVHVIGQNLGHFCSFFHFNGYPVRDRRRVNFTVRFGEPTQVTDPWPATSNR